MKSADDNFLFTGDCLFEGGIGRPFEGSIVESCTIMAQIEASIGGKTRLFFGHDYGFKNYLWAQDYILQMQEFL